MKKYYILCTLISVFQSTFSQVTFGEIKKREIIHYKAPKPFDSISDFHKENIDISDLTELDKIKDYYLRDSIEKKLELNDFKKYIGLDFYLPENSNVTLVSKNKQIVKNEKDEIVYTNYYKPLTLNDGRLERDYNEPKNSYYKIIDVNNLKLISTKIKNEFDSIKSIYEVPYCGSYDVCFTALRKNTNDTIYIGYQDLDLNFAFVPYFVKMKKLFDGKKMVAINDVKYHNLIKEIDVTTSKEFTVPHLSKWICEINLLKGSSESNKPKFIFRNDIGQTIVLNNWCRSRRSNGYQEGYKHYDDLYFLTEEEYLRIESIKKLKEAERNIENNKRNNLEKLRQKKYLEKCVNLYGETNGNLIAKNEIEIGMNKEMCLLSWGKPYDIYTVKTENKVIEILFYSYQKTLHFENNILFKIEY